MTKPPRSSRMPARVPGRPTPDGNRRRVLLSTDELMLVEFGFDKGGVGALHSHPHVQSSYVAEGRFEVTIDGRTEILEAGGSFIVPSWSGAAASRRWKPGGWSTSSDAAPGSIFLPASTARADHGP